MIIAIDDYGSYPIYIYLFMITCFAVNIADQDSWEWSSKGVVLVIVNVT